ncbi:glycosyl hydrolase [Mucilaginibacter sp. PAMB04168]|uniref:glycoside hydrolase family 26 protein n=1 Tax=Mucilaginibacter sp. PAMB04168 TaxID=3138567 RepID=UPI0031F67EF3
MLLSIMQIAVAQQQSPADTLATTETRWLLSSMRKLTGAGVLFGHHDATAYGVNWRLKDSSDIKNVTGSYPAVYGWDLSGIEVDSTYDINAIPFATQSRLVREAYERGGVNTFCWHMHNPVNGKSAWDTVGTTVDQLLPGGSFHQTYLTYLDKAAKYISTLNGRDGEPIPILFRPFHELTGEWFWWGIYTATPDEFKELWRFTVNYLRNTKKLHNLLMVYSAADFYEELELLERYPGDDYVDFMGFDRYCFDSTALYQRNMNRQLKLLQQVADEHHKLTCIAETGYQGLPVANWWTETLGPILSQNNKISYLLIWRNNGPEHYYAPYPGQVSAPDFKQFYQSNYIMFQDKLTPLEIYGPKHAQRYNRKAGP